MAALAEQLLEREHEIALLTNALERAARGQGAGVVVEGAPGIGKTSLLEVTAEIAAQQGLAVLRARGGELEQALAFGIARDLLARRLAEMPERDRSRLLTGAALAAVPALGLGEAPGVPADEAAVNHGLTWLVTDLADSQPLALIVDDVQWADPASATWLAHLARRVGDLPVALLLGARPPAGGMEPPGVVALRELPDLERLRPEPLAQPAVAALVRSFYAADADDEFVTACHEAAGGNPFHTHALLDAAAAQEVPANSLGSSDIARLAPEAVRRSVAAALRRAGPEAAALAKACSVLGESVALGEAGALAGLDPSTASGAADRLMEQNLLVRERPLRFVHPILLAAVRESVAPGERLELHRAAVDLFVANGDHRRAAAHLLEVEPAGDPAVVATLGSAARAAAREGAMEHAVRLLERVLAEPPPAHLRPALLSYYGQARVFARMDGGVEALLAAADAVDDPEHGAQMLTGAVWGAMYGAQQLLPEVISRIDTLPISAGEGIMRAQAARALAAQFAGIPAQPPTAELIARAEQLAGDTPAECELIAAASFSAFVEGTLSAGRLASLTQRAIRPDSPGAFIAAMVAATSSPSDEVLAAIDSMLAAVRELGYGTNVDGLVVARCLAFLSLGRLREAEAEARMLFRVTGEASYRSAMWSASVFAMVQTLAVRGGIAEADQILAQHAASQHHLAPYMDQSLEGTAGVLALECGDLTRGIELLLAFESDLESAGHLRSWSGEWHRAPLVDALVRTGDLDTARELAGKDLQLARTLDAPRPIGCALRGMGLVAGGGEGRALLEESATLLEQADDPNSLARTLLDLGRMLRRDGMPREARDPLRRALELADGCGAELVAQRALDELRAAGGRPRRRVLSGPESLTAGEARVARLAAEGRTNREIAQELFLSTKTVETHLGHIYGKLAISGRGGLAEALADG